MATTAQLFTLGQAITDAQDARRKYETLKPDASADVVRAYADTMARRIQAVAVAISALI